MTFISFRFFAFFVITAALYFAVPGRFRWVVPLLSSYVFYMSAGPIYGLLIFCTTMVSYFCGLGMGTDRSRRQKTPYLLVAVFADLGALLFFKYFDFFSRSMTVVLGQINIAGALPNWGCWCPWASPSIPCRLSLTCLTSTAAT